MDGTPAPESNEELSLQQAIDLISTSLTTALAKEPRSTILRVVISLAEIEKYYGKCRLQTVVLTQLRLRILEQLQLDRR